MHILTHLPSWARIFLVIGLALTAGVAFYTWYVWWTRLDGAQEGGSHGAYATSSIVIGGTPIIADIADTPNLRQRGLGGRAGLVDGTGMLFVFDHSDTYGFWMKDMLFPIDIVWIDSDKRIIYSAENIAPETYPQSYVPPIPARYVLELPAGFMSAHRVRVGDSVAI